MVTMTTLMSMTTMGMSKQVFLSNRLAVWCTSVLMLWSSGALMLWCSGVHTRSRCQSFSRCFSSSSFWQKFCLCIDYEAHWFFTIVTESLRRRWSGFASSCPCSPLHRTALLIHLLPSVLLLMYTTLNHCKFTLIDTFLCLQWGLCGGFLWVRSKQKCR